MRNVIVKSGFWGLFFFGLTGLLAAEVRYTVTDLGTLGGGYSVALDINNFGQVVGQSKLADGSEHAFLWENGNMTDLGSGSEALAVNDHGQVVGTLRVNDMNHAAVWQNGQWTNLSLTAEESSVAWDINNAGQIVGCSKPSYGAANAVLWQNGNAPITITPGEGKGLNQKGHIVGDVQLDDANQTVKGFLIKDGTPINLGSLGGSWTYVNKVNDLDQVVGMSDDGQTGYHAFLWQNGTMINIGLAGEHSSRAFDINNFGQVVGGIEFPNNNYRAFLYSSGITQDLNNLIPSNYEWPILGATGINDLGQITGTALVNNEYHAILLNPVPEPAMMLLIALGMCPVLRRKNNISQ